MRWGGGGGSWAAPEVNGRAAAGARAAWARPGQERLRPSCPLGGRRCPGCEHGGCGWRSCPRVPRPSRPKAQLRMGWRRNLEWRGGPA